MLAFIAVVGAVFGAVVTPLVGWLLIERLPFWLAVLMPMLGAVLGENIAALWFSSLQTDVLVMGAIVGALVTALSLRIALPKR